MSKIERAANLAGVVGPLAGFLTSVVLTRSRWVDGIDLALFAAAKPAGVRA